jgi:hypothetical protein
MRFYRDRANDPEKVLTEDEARAIWERDSDNQSEAEKITGFYKRFEGVTGEAATLADIKHIITTHGPADEYKYMLLGRLEADCRYYLGNGNRYAGHLWARSVGTHLECMRLLYDSFPESERPEWLTREQIEDYEKEMNPQKGAGSL